MPALSSDKRSTTPKERIIPIEIEGKSKTRYANTSLHEESSKSAKKKSVIEVRDASQDHWEVKVEEPMQKKSKDSKKDLKDSKKDPKDAKKASKKDATKEEPKKDSKKESKKAPAKDSKVDSKKEIKESKKDSKKESKKEESKKESKRDKEEVDENKNVIEKSKKKADSKEDSKKGPKGKKSEPEVTITTQPSKSILKQPVASSTPLPDAPHDSAWLDQSTTSTGTVVRKKPSAGSKCKSWLCMPCGLCCACAPFECECCDCCYLKCSRCEQCLCQCCNRKCC